MTLSCGIALKAVAQSDKMLVANAVYVHNADVVQLTGGTVASGSPLYVDIKGFIFSMEVSASVKEQTIQLSKMHREYAKIMTGQEVTVKMFSPPPAFDLGFVKLEVDYLRKPSPDAHRVEVNDKDLEAMFRTHFQAQVLATRQCFALDFQGIWLKLTVLALQPVDLGSGTAAKHHTAGLLGTLTEIEIQQGISGKLHILSNNMQQRSIFHPNFSFEELGIGGLTAEFGNIFRRAFASRMSPPKVVRDLGIKHVRGMILHGPPGTGKTLIARQLARFLKAAEPKIVNGPEILNKYVGQAEENIRTLFADAEREFAQKGDNSQLHVVIFDEIDSICKSRGSSRDSTGVHDSIVNQLLTKIDGVGELDNILLIGMTNRIDLLDEALVRQGRFELHVEISLPDEAGRVEILNIHTQNMREKGYLDPIVSIPALAAQTNNFSGAEIEGLIRSASSFMLNRQVHFQDLGKSIDMREINLTTDDIELALTEVKPAFGAHISSFEHCITRGIMAYSREFESVLRTCTSLVNQVRGSENTPLLTLLLHGPVGCGKTALAAHLARSSDYPFMRRIAAETLVGYTEQAKVSAISKVFEDAYKSPLSIIVLDDLERLMDYARVGPRFSNFLLQAMMLLLKKQPPKKCQRLLVICTSSEPDFLEEVGFFHTFNVAIDVPTMSAPEHFKHVLEELPGFEAPALHEICRKLQHRQIGIKKLLLMAEVAVNRQKPVPCEVFMECLHQCGCV
mmetsp:Transcript_48792/g.97073  ORF Transcript_48792/g.97073 Transcript_48792/m.97073 type:complete len:735 (-) Transcript_48792:303-2507(-)